MKEFQPEYSGKMNFYISAVDDLLRHPDDQPTIGIILCRGKKKTVAEYPSSVTFRSKQVVNKLNYPEA